MRTELNPKLTLVGAGPGDPDLISVKGIKALADADVILYDDLVSKELLAYAKQGTEKIYVGKRVGKHSHTQQAINELIVHFAHEKGHVVRLKGGDPFVFGRGYEEVEYAAKYGIKSDIVSGISSAYAVPAMQNIPLTSRGVSQSFWVVTATTKEGTLTPDIKLAAQSTATIVILMGTKKLDQICEVFSTLNKSHTPVAIIQNGTMPNEKMVTGTMGSISQIAAEEQIGSPAIIVIGEVVRLGKQAWIPQLQQNLQFQSYGE
ncbi:uroporphyrinogen-III C-methyltransferase [Roseivirga pacifica]|uniref:uroporphyrinogen-III C-methyltransferase n=1 Tax=Roseivirga pacifica TaxID=1267423 RepID=UPI0020958EA3|nr:uroporphyrinogen-III C-methyltransferase [Roseivirga pacifica]MCO6358301.1 uroporphyrinogen-III C-methyltransferase [Roseivirga pacifica]MCO6366235.1 uroporphyrinogen-III C-methyltransferase [Roseivirga pacifica]MCO6369214.1 uroporphyrinogen-III C-methyltransferase [Roseivirga pacifica]MCO6374032.1 uroporphyrinogen-III C-methyltransferase [Roseivirga pacifica]MCO6378408.1 uroporphyrinogen-III C-methyltransferase [Roseivirga pacifica]